jgi:Heparan-alpha-glucosaminide N-acetyltransferase, catalytic
MMAVHILPSTTADGRMSLPWALSAGKSAALFAVVAGVGIAMSSGRRQLPEGRIWTASAASLAVRAAVIGLVGLLLGAFVPIRDAAVILPYYAVLFVLAIPLLRLPVRWLVTLALVIAVVVPVLSHLVRGRLPSSIGANPAFGDLMQAPGRLAAELTLTGVYPALPWMAYLCIGLAVGRSRLSRGVVVGFTIAGAGLALTASALSWVLLDVAGGRAELATVAMRSMSLEEYTDLLVWGAAGTLPTTSAWWLAVKSPHTTTPLDLLFTIGVAVAVLGTALALGRVAGPRLGPRLGPLAAAGRMPLTLYAAHVLLLAAPVEPLPWAEYSVHVAVLVGFALAWSRGFPRGPLEQLLWWATDTVRRAIVGRTGHAAEQASAVRPGGR